MIRGYRSECNYLNAFRAIHSPSKDFKLFSIDYIFLSSLPKAYSGIQKRFVSYWFSYVIVEATQPWHSSAKSYSRRRPTRNVTMDQVLNFIPVFFLFPITERVIATQTVPSNRNRWNVPIYRVRCRVSRLFMRFYRFRTVRKNSTQIQNLPPPPLYGVLWNNFSTERPFPTVPPGAYGRTWPGFRHVGVTRSPLSP